MEAHFEPHTGARRLQVVLARSEEEGAHGTTIVAKRRPTVAKRPPCVAERRVVPDLERIPNPALEGLAMLCGDSLAEVSRRNLVRRQAAVRLSRRRADSPPESEVSEVAV